MNKQPLILVVEPNLDNLEILNSRLQELNLSCLCAKQGVRALILAQTHQPDLILLDMKLPDLSGIQVIYYLKRNPETACIPIIAFTDLIRDQELDSMRLTGVDSWINKPYDFTKIEFAVRQHIESVNSFN